MARRGYHGKGYVRQYETKSGTRWSFQVRVPADPTRPDLGTRQMERGGFLSEKEAAKAMQQAQRDAERGLRMGSKVPTLDAYARQWLDSLDLAAATVSGYRTQLTRHVLPRIGELTLDQITPTVLNTLYRQLQVEPPPATDGRWKDAGPLGANSVRKIATTMGAVLDAAVADRHIADNPARSAAVRRPSRAAVVSQSVEMTVWTADQMTMFLRWAREVRQDPEYPLWAMFAATVPAAPRCWRCGGPTSTSRRGGCISAALWTPPALVRRRNRRTGSRAPSPSPRPPSPR